MTKKIIYSIVAVFIVSVVILLVENEKSKKGTWESYDKIDTCFTNLDGDFYTIFKKNNNVYVAYGSYDFSDGSYKSLPQLIENSVNINASNLRILTVSSNNCIFVDDNRIFYFYDNSLERTHDYDYLLKSPYDLETFYAIRDYSIINYAKDKNNVYYTSKQHDPLFYEKIDLADPKSFVPLDNGYAKDNKNVYYEGKIVKGVDASTFTSCKIGSICSMKDKNNKYDEKLNIVD